MTAVDDRLVQLGPDCARIPERLLLAHAKGQVLFIAGAGVSQPAGLPDFKQLVLQVYQGADVGTHAVLQMVAAAPADPATETAIKGLAAKQQAEVRRFQQGDYDVVLGMLERRLDGIGSAASKVRTAVCDLIRNGAAKHAPLHRALMRLADRGGATSLITTNFDLLLQSACRGAKPSVPTYTLGAIPRPGRRKDFAGVLHIHGALSKDKSAASDIIVTDHDFGEIYLRRRLVPDFIYDAARLYNIVLVGYSANDAPMRYLLNAVAADGSRFDDLKERFTFVGGPQPPDLVRLEDWIGRGITPIPYDQADHHSQLLKTMERWAELSAHNGKPLVVERTIRRLVKKPRAASDDAERDLFDHLMRRADRNERLRLSTLAAGAGAALDWLDAIAAVAAERDRGPS